MIEAAWNAIKNSPFWKKKYEQLTRRMDKQKAATAIARKLLVVVWNVLTKREVDRAAIPDKVGASLMDWGTKHRLATSLGMKREVFTGKQLDTLGIQLAQVKYGPRVYLIPRTDLQSSERRPKQVKPVNST
jgi:hypothetical protein